jgi:hypothetical protein
VTSFGAAISAGIIAKAWGSRSRLQERRHVSEPDNDDPEIRSTPLSRKNWVCCRLR